MRTLGLIAAGWLVAAVPGLGQALVSSYVPTLTFDVASVRQSPPADSYMVVGSFVAHSSLLKVTNFDMKNLLGLAYGYDGYYLVVGVPESFGRVMFDIQAKGDSAADEKLAQLSKRDAALEQQHMVQALLADRFKLKAHWETREGDVFNLVAKNAAKLARAKGEPTSAETLKAWGDNPVPPLYQRGDSRTGFDFVAHGATMEMIVNMLAGQFGRPVVDQTGLTGKYDFTLRYFGTRDRDRSENETNSAAPLETGIQDQLGLKLEAGKGPVRVLVVDRLEKPSEN